MYAKVINGEVVKQKYLYREFLLDMAARGIEVVEPLSKERMAQLGRVPFIWKRPLHNHVTERAVEDGIAVVNGVWTQLWRIEPRPLTLTDKKADVVRQIEELGYEKRQSIIAGIHPGEIGSWPIKRDEAIAYRASESETDAPNLASEAADRGISLDALVDKVLVKAALFSGLESAIAGRSGALQDAVLAAADEIALAAIDITEGWPV